MQSIKKRVMELLSSEHHIDEDIVAELRGMLSDLVISIQEVALMDSK
jgi:hypothetical protein